MSIFDRFTLGAKFTLLLALVFLAGMVLSWFALSQALQNKAEREVMSKAQILLQTMNAVRQYTTENINRHVKPLLDQRTERCLATGMDDHVAKPFRHEQLRSLLSKWVVREPVVAEAALPPPVDSKALDNIRALQRPGAPSLLERIVSLYLADAPRLIATMREAVAAGDAKALQHASHQLKSSSANLGAGTLAELCKAIEGDARGGSTAAAGRSLSAVDREFARVRAALAEMAVTA